MTDSVSAHDETPLATVLGKPWIDEAVDRAEFLGQTLGVPPILIGDIAGQLCGAKSIRRLDEVTPEHLALVILTAMCAPPTTEIREVADAFADSLVRLSIDANLLPVPRPARNAMAMLGSFIRHPQEMNFVSVGYGRDGKYPEVHAVFAWSGPTMAKFTATVTAARFGDSDLVGEMRTLPKAAIWKIAKRFFPMTTPTTEIQ